MKRDDVKRDGSKRYHDRIARQYDAIYDDPYWHFHDELTWRLIKPHLPRDVSARCADLGCGTGKWGLRLIKTGFDTTFLDNSGAMIAQVRQKLEVLGHKSLRATVLVGDIVELSQIDSEQFDLILAMGDPLSICSDPVRAVREFHRISRPGATVIATADNKLAALDHFVEQGNLADLEEFVRTGKTNWLTTDPREQFALTTFTPASLRKMFEKGGFEVIEIAGKPIIPSRRNKRLLEADDSIDRLIRLETELSKDPAAAARASHLQIVAKKNSNAKTSP